MGQNLAQVTMVIMSHNLVERTVVIMGQDLAEISMFVGEKIKLTDR